MTCCFQLTKLTWFGLISTQVKDSFKHFIGKRKNKDYLRRLEIIGIYIKNII